MTPREGLLVIVVSVLLSIVAGGAFVLYSWVKLRFNKGAEEANVNLHRARLGQLQHSLLLVHGRLKAAADTSGKSVEHMQAQIRSIADEIEVLANYVKAQQVHLNDWHPGKQMAGGPAYPETGIPKKPEEKVSGTATT